MSVATQTHGKSMTNSIPTSTVERGYVATPWGQVHFRRAGKLGPALALFHESPLSSREFERALPILGRTFRAIAFDTPGYGESDSPETPISLPEYARRLEAALDELEIDRFAAAGVHTGAAIAAEIARKAPRRVSHLIFSGMPLLTAEQRQQFKSRLTVPAFDRHGSHLVDAWQGRRKSWGEDVPDELLQWGTLDLLKAYPRYLWALEAVFSHDCAPALAVIACPTLFINAEGDSLAPIDKIAAASVAGAALRIVADIRGQLPWRAPELYAEAVRDFVGP
ncbi:MAG: alpha/beta hydrolase [Alphaproteobacteria bacterium]|nr:alpha/beta hydrolase [Alphaproteobacteria bacterium]